jgi:hypothetical protein
LLRGEEALRLNRARLAIVALGNVENYRVCVQLWRNVAIDRAGRIMFKFRGDEPARGLRRMIPADSGLRIVFKLVEGNSDALPMRFPDALVAANKRGERYRFGRGKGRIPPGSVLHRLDGLAFGILIFIGRSLAHQLLSGLWMLSLAEFREVLGRDGPGKAELPGQSPLPFACYDAALRPIVLLLRGELLLVVGLCLAGGERLGNGKHGSYYPRRLRLCWVFTLVSSSVSRCGISVAVRGAFRCGGVGTFGSGLISSGRAWDFGVPMFFGS